MPQEFDKDYWESHWQEANAHGSEQGTFPNPYLAHETSSLVPGTALDAGCGEGAEAIWLASEGWQVTAADISAEALSRAAERERRFGVPRKRVRWVEADLSVWEPDTKFDLVTTHYAHPAMPQLDFYKRLAPWVAEGGTLLIVGHLHTPDAGGHGHDHDPPEAAMADAVTITRLLDSARWDVVTAVEHTRTVTTGGGREAYLNDVVVRATRI
jgi:SAM-dependent methyltransferase